MFPEIDVWQVTFPSLLMIRGIIRTSIIVVSYFLVIIEER